MTNEKKESLLLKLASHLNGLQDRVPVAIELEREARRAGIVIAYGASDDLIEFRGAVHDELGAPGTFWFTPEDGLLRNQCAEDDSCPYFEKLKLGAATVHLSWSDKTPPWQFTTRIPHETFNVMDGDELWCKGIVFFLSDVKEGL